MSWDVKVTMMGSTESVNVDGETIADAVQNGLAELGYDGNDEGALTIEVTGEADD